MDVLASREEVDGLFAGADLAPDVELPGDLDVGCGLIAGVGHVDDDVELVTESSDVVDPRGGHRRFVLAGHLDRYQQHHRGKDHRSEEHTSELQSLMRISYAVFCLQK